MTPDEKSLLERTYSLAVENNKMLKSIRRASHASLIMRGIYWLVIIGASFGAYYLIQPYIDALSSAFGQGGGTTTEIMQSGFGGAQSSVTQLMDLLK